MNWDNIYRTSPALSLRPNPWGSLAATIDETESNVLEMTPEEFEILRSFGDARTPREVYQTLASRGDIDRETYTSTVLTWIELGLLISDYKRNSDIGRLRAFRAAVERCLASQTWHFPLRSPLPDQRPVFFYPGLNSQEFHNPAGLTWCAELEREFPAIRGEVSSLVSRQLGFETKSDSFTSTGAWTGAYLWAYGQKIAETAGLCPTTAAVIEKIRGAAKIGTAFFSALASKTFVRPHTGNTNAKLRCHLPLIVPAGCALKVGDREEELVEGKCVVFDDSFVHSAWNRSESIRVVLVVDFFHPDLTPAEIEYLSEVIHKLDPSAQNSGSVRNSDFPAWLALAP